MPIPLDVYLSRQRDEPLEPSRQEAIDAVLASGCKEEHQEFWVRVSRVEAVCNKGSTTPKAAAKALAFLAPFIETGWDYGEPASIPERNFNTLIARIAKLMRDGRVT